MDSGLLDRIRCYGGGTKNNIKYAIALLSAREKLAFCDVTSLPYMDIN